MNCDLVFEILTRGPFPSGEPTDASVELHLGRCHECRRLAEALRPAVELFHETLSAEGEVESLPGYYGSLGTLETPHATAVASAAARGERSEEQAPGGLRTARRKSFPFRRAAQVGAGMALGAALCFAVAVFLVQLPAVGARLGLGRGAPAAANNAALAPPFRTGEARTVLASLHLPVSCLVSRSDAPVLPAATGAVPEAPLTAAAPKADNLLCCTHCHNAAQARRPHVSAVALLQREACATCHRWQ